MRIVRILGLIRFLSAFTILIEPFWGTVLCLLIDSADHSILVFSGARDKFNIDKYEVYDKFFDLWQYIFMFIVSLKTTIPHILIVLFIIRAVGNIIFLIKQERKIFLYTPNIFENVFITYFALSYFGDLNLGENQPALIYTVFICTVLKITQEFLVHWKDFFPFAPIYKFFGKKNYYK